MALYCLPGFADSNYLNSSIECIPQTDLVGVANKFKQFSELVDRKEICRSEIGDQYFKIVHTLVALKNYRPDFSRVVDTQDVFTIDVLGKISKSDESSWWDYFTKRINYLVDDTSRFSFEEELGDCGTSTVALVNFSSFIGEKRPITVCRHFFEVDVYQRIMVFLHEARHVDGIAKHEHVECIHGEYEGFDGACDKDFFSYSSYAVTVSLLAKFGVDQNLTYRQRFEAKQSAIYHIWNSFNIIPPVKYREVIYFVTSDGKIRSINLTTGTIQVVREEKAGTELYSNHNGGIVLREKNRWVKAYSEDSWTELPWVLEDMNQAQRLLKKKEVIDWHGAGMGQFFTKDRVIADCDDVSALLGRDPLFLSEAGFEGDYRGKVIIEEHPTNYQQGFITQDNKHYYAYCQFGSLIIEEDKNCEIPSDLNEVYIGREFIYGVDRKGSLVQYLKDDIEKKKIILSFSRFGPISSFVFSRVYDYFKKID